MNCLYRPTIFICCCRPPAYMGPIKIVCWVVTSLYFTAFSPPVYNSSGTLPMAVIGTTSYGICRDVLALYIRNILINCIKTAYLVMLNLWLLNEIKKSGLDPNQRFVINGLSYNLLGVPSLWAQDSHLQIALKLKESVKLTVTNFSLTALYRLTDLWSMQKNKFEWKTSFWNSALT